ncbi:MAG: FAD-dependent oxidoreductase [Acidobacteriota bacterium]
MIIVGAGISGLSAALEAARSGAKVTVVDMSTVGGGHAVMSNGALCIVATPFQEKNQVRDSIELAERERGWAWQVRCSANACVTQS